MSIMTTNQLWKDTVELRKEYQEESKQQYADLFSKYFDEINAYIVHSRPLPTLLLSKTYQDILLVCI